MSYNYCPYCMSYTAPGQNCPGCGSFPGAYRPQGHHFPPGRLLGNRYYVGRVLGEGGFGITYLGFDTKLERRVAIKEYYPRTLVHRDAASSMNVTCYTGSAPTFERGREQFLSEARTLSRLDSIPQIVRVMDFFPENNSAYIVMEFLEGITLKDIMMQRGRIPVQELLGMLEPVLGGMQSMHNAGIIHRDISPDNLMVMNHTGQVKLMDFGCARELIPGRAMTVVLKPGFAPIEQSAGQEQGPWTDVYGMCATIYYCLTGVIPPDANQRLLYDTLLPPSRYGVQISPAQEQALMKGLAVNAIDRWYSITDLYYGLFVNTSYVGAAKPQKVHRNAAHSKHSAQPRRAEQQMQRVEPIRQAGQMQRMEPVQRVEQVRQPEPAQKSEVFGHTEYAYSPQKGKTEYLRSACVYPDNRSATPVQQAAPVVTPAVRKQRSIPWLTILAVCVCVAVLACVAAVLLNSPETQHEHSFGDWVVVREPTCTRVGLQARRCSCGEEMQEEIPTHRRKLIPGTPAGCGVYGVTDGIVCADCGKVFQRQTKISPLGHDWEPWRETVPAGCVTQGTKLSTCSRCGNIKRATIDPTGHSYKNGRCTVCGHEQH